MIYSFTFSTIDIQERLRLHDFIKTNSRYTDWWHYLNDSYLIETKETMKFTATVLRLSFPKLTFTLIEVNLNRFEGNLPKDAWKWISDKRTRPILLSALPPITERVKPGEKTDPSLALLKLLNQSTKK